MKNLVGAFLLAAGALAMLPLFPAQTLGQPAAQQEVPPAAAPEQTAVPSQTAAPSPAPSGPVIALDPAHGGTDSGARGPSAVEKDIVLEIARSVRAELERQGFRVVLTRNDDSNPSYDDRAATANGYRDAIFISLHISSTGTPGAVRAYYDQFDTPIPPAVVAAGASANSATPPGISQTGVLTPWNEAQRPYSTESHRLADLVQIEIAQHFPASPDTSSGVAVRGLRSVAGPAIAIELSSISAPYVNSLTGAAVPLASAIARAIQAFRAPGAAGAR
ncbi:MAG: N-acetylmuramoyl-L-alanine amidase [Candidatus Acidiferrales bacterium]